MIVSSARLVVTLPVENKFSVQHNRFQPAGKTGARHEWQKHCITESRTSPISMLRIKWTVYNVCQSRVAMPADCATLARKLKQVGGEPPVDRYVPRSATLTLQTRPASTPCALPSLT